MTQYLQQQRIFADPLNRCEQVSLQGDICAFLPSQQHTVLKKTNMTDTHIKCVVFNQ